MIILVDSNIEKKYLIDDSIFIYKEALPRDVEKLYQEHQDIQKGVFNIDICSVRDFVLAKYVVGWENVADGNGNQIPFDSELLSALPSEVRNKLYTAITSGRVSE